VTPWSAKPGLGTPDGLPFQTIPNAATLWWQARRWVRSVRLPEPRWDGRPCDFDAEMMRQAAIAAARGGAR
jgi:hypothetical protein